MAMSEPEITEALAALPRWTRNGDAIVCDRTCDDFAAALALVNRVGALAEAADHHPDILLHGWNRVRISLSTHSAGGLTSRDFRLAAQIDGLG